MGAIVCRLPRPEYDAIQFKSTADIEEIQNASGIDSISFSGGKLSLLHDDSDIKAHELNVGDWFLIPRNGAHPFVVTGAEFQAGYRKIRPKKEKDT